MLVCYWLHLVAQFVGLSAIGGIPSQGRLLMQMQDHAYKAEDVVRFLRLLLRQISGKLLVIWDGASIHRAKEVKDFLRARGCQTAASGTLALLCPELNPQEGVWNLLKDVNSRISAVGTCPTWLMSFGMPKNACDIDRPFCNSASLMRDALFSYLCRGQ